MIVVRDRGSVFPLVCRSVSAPSAVEAATKKSTDKGPSRDPRSLAFVVVLCMFFRGETAVNGIESKVFVKVFVWALMIGNVLRVRRN